LNDSNPYAEEIRVARAIARDAGALVARYYRNGARTWEKSEGNPVTQADLDADALIREGLERSFPEDGQLTEESSDDLSRLERSRVWIVDPIDGTREFTKQIPEFAISIALVVDERPVLGVVCNPIAEVTVSGSLGWGVERNGEPAGLSDCTTLSQARVAASRSEDDDGKLQPYAPLFGELRPMGSIAWKLALVACGDADFNLSVKPKNEWDVCAGDFLVHEAGGGYVDFEDQTLSYNQRDPLREESMIAGSRRLIEEFLERRPKPEPRYASSDR
jgi:myo-inositol-1(or 4)-monophosphatase